MILQQVDINGAKDALDAGTATFVDIRDPRSHAQARIPGCRHITSQEAMDALVNEIDKDAKVIVYCYHGNASQGAALYLQQRGFANVSSMSGGFEAWRQTYEVESTE